MKACADCLTGKPPGRAEEESKPDADDERPPI